MALDSRDIAVIAVLCAVAFLALLAVATYRFSPSLLERRHRARPPPAAPRAGPEDAERINPVKLDRFLSNTTQSPSVTSSRASSSAAAAGAGAGAARQVRVPAEGV